MPRQTAKPRTVRKEANLLVGNVLSPVRLQVTRRNLLAAGRGNERGVEQARALEEVFVTGTNFLTSVLERRARKAELAGTVAAIEGREPTADELRSDAFTIAHNEVLTKAQFIEVEGDMAKAWAKLDTAKFTAGQTRTWAAEQLSDAFSGLDPESDLDVATMRLVNPWAEEVELAFISQNQEEQLKRVQQESDAAFELTTRASLADGTYKLLEVKEELLKKYGGKRVNVEIFSLLRSIAISDGRPELIEELAKLKNWGKDAKGSPAPGGIRAFDDRILDAIRQARAQKRDIEKRGEAESKDAEEERLDKLSADLFLSTLDSKSITDDLRDAVEAGLSDESARAIFNFHKNFTNAITGEIDHKALSDLQQESFEPGFNTHEAMTKIGEMARAGKLGNFQERLVIAQRERDRLNKMETARRSDPFYLAARSTLAAHYRAANLLMNTDERYKIQMTKADAMLLELVAVQGVPADEARDKVIAAIPRPDKQGAGQFAAAIRAFVDNDLPVTSLLQFWPKGTTILQFLQQLENDGLELSNKDKQELNDAARKRSQGAN